MTFIIIAIIMITTPLIGLTIFIPSIDFVFYFYSHYKILKSFVRLIPPVVW